MELARQTRGKRGAFPAYFSVKSRAMLELEAEATNLFVVTIDLIPAHFQTESYMQALFEGNGEGLPQSEIDRLKRVRIDRQAILEQSKPPRVRAVIHETALRLPISGTEVMHEQLLHLAEVAELSNVEIQVQPIAEAANPNMGIAFTLLRLANGGDCVEVAFGPHGPLMRDSKTAERGRTLQTSPAAFAAFLAAVKG